MPSFTYCLGCDHIQSEEKIVLDDDHGRTIRCLDCETADECEARERREDGDG